MHACSTGGRAQGAGGTGHGARGTGLGLGCGSGPLTGRYNPPFGGALYFCRPGTIKMPLFPGIPIFGGLQMARWIHHIAMWFILGFVGHHIWSAMPLEDLRRYQSNSLFHRCRQHRHVRLARLTQVRLSAPHPASSLGRRGNLRQA